VSPELVHLEVGNSTSRSTVITSASLSWDDQMMTFAAPFREPQRCLSSSRRDTARHFGYPWMSARGRSDDHGGQWLRKGPSGVRGCSWRQTLQCAGIARSGELMGIFPVPSGDEGRASVQRKGCRNRVRAMRGQLGGFAWRSVPYAVLSPTCAPSAAARGPAQAETVVDLTESD